jgi:hypothetical protein
MIEAQKLHENDQLVKRNLWNVPKIIKKNPKKITTCNQFDLDTLGL